MRENIADNGGLKEAWLAFKNHTSHSTRPALVNDEYDGLEDDQLFFYAYAHVSHSRSFITSHEARGFGFRNELAMGGGGTFPAKPFREVLHHLICERFLPVIAKRASRWR